jgi:hypothetical protein
VVWKTGSGYEASQSLVALGTVDVVPTLLTIFRKAKPSGLTADGDFGDQPVTGVKTTLGPSGAGEDIYPAEALLKIPGAIEVLKEVCSTEELELIILTGSHPYVGGWRSLRPEDYTVFERFGTFRAAGALLLILWQSDNRTKLPAAWNAFVNIGRKHPEYLTRLAEYHSGGLFLMIRQAQEAISSKENTVK